MRRIEIAVAASLFVEAILYLAVIPLLPQYVDRFGLSTTEAGLVMAVLPLAIVTTSIPLGYLGSRYGNRRVVVAGNVLQTIATLVFAFAPNVATLVAARAVQGFGSAVIWGAAMSWLTANAPTEERGAYVGRAMAFVSAGAIAGPAVGALGGATSVSVAFCLVALAAVAATIMTLSAPAGTIERAGAGLWAGVASSVREPLVIAAFALATAAAACEAVTNLLAPLRLGSLGYGAVAIGAALLIGAVVAFALATRAGRLIDRVGPLRVGMAAGATTVVLLLALAVGPGAFVLFTVLGVLSVVFMFQATAVYPMATAGADRSSIPHGVVNGVINLSWAGGVMAGQLAAGAIADLLGEAAAYMIAAGFIVVLLVVAERLGRNIWRSNTESANVLA